jgi:hypothetical protein
VSPYAERLVAQIFQFDQPAGPGSIKMKPLDSLDAETGHPTQLVVPNLVEMDGYKIALEGFYLSGPGTPLEIVCVSGINDTTGNSVAILCRSTDKTDSIGLQAKVEQ